MRTEDLIVIPLPTLGKTVTYAVARLITDGDEVFAEAISEIPDTVFAPPRRIRLSRYSITRAKAGSAGRPDLYLYEGMILPPQ